MSVIGKHGISSTTPQNILLGAGTIHKNFEWDAEASAWKGDVIGATSGGNKVTISGELVDLDIDGALVKVKGFTVMRGGTASMEVNYAELTTDIIKMGVIGETSTSDATGYDLVKPKSKIEEGDYVSNFAFVGTTTDGSKNIIIIFENALCTSGFEVEGKNKENSTVKLTMEAYAAIDGDLETIPVKIYWPSAS